MNPSRWQRLKSLFESAMDLPSRDRREYIAGLSDPRQASGLERLLEEQNRSGGFLEQAAFHVPDSTITLRSFSPGEIIAERFSVVRFIGRGGMGDVYEAEDTAQTRRPHIALKTVRSEIAANLAIRRQFEREIEIGKTITHPNVCRIYDLGLHRDFPGAAGKPRPAIMFLTMELLDGPTLAEHLHRTGPMPLDQALPIIEQLCGGLHAAHQARVVHRDLKPGNIMLVPVRNGSGLRAVITDFGLAREVAGPDSPASMTDGVAGTPDYMSPEQVMGGQLAPSSDIYSLGVVIYQMITGRLPFEAAQPRSRMLMRLREPPIPPRAHLPTLPESWQIAVVRCLQREPQARFERADDLMLALRGQLVSAATPSAKLLYSRTKILAAACTIAVLAIGGVGWSRWSHTGALSGPALLLYTQGTDNIHAGAYFAATKALQQTVKLAPTFAPARARLAESWYELDLPEQAAREFLPVRRYDLSSLSKRDRLQIEAVDLTITREFAAAAAKYEKVLQETGTDSADANIDLGRAYEKAGNPTKAIEAHLRAATGPAHSPAAWLRLGVLYSQQSKTADAEKAFAEADQGYRLSSNLEGLTELALQRGVAANNHGQWGQAVAFLQKAIERARDAGNLQQEISAKLTLANNAFASGDSTIAESYARDALAAAQGNQMEALTIRGFVNLGNAYLRKGDFEGARKHLQGALTLARRTNSPRLTALGLFALAAFHDRLGQAEDQIREAREALAYYAPNRWTQQSLQCLTLIGRGESARENYPAALDSFQRLLASAEKTKDKRQMIVAQESLGDVFFAQEQYPRALAHYQEFLRLSDTPEKLGYASLACAKTLWRLGRYPEAQARFKKAEDPAATFPQLRLFILRSQAEMLLSQARWGEAAVVAQQALGNGNSIPPLTFAGLTRILGLAWLRSGQRAMGQHKCEDALRAAEQAKDPTALLEARIAVLEASVSKRDSIAASKVFNVLEPALQAHLESRWRVFSLMGRVDSQYLDSARSALAAIESEWGEAQSRQYLTRQDLLKPSWPQLNVKTARHNEEKQR